MVIHSCFQLCTIGVLLSSLLFFFFFGESLYISFFYKDTCCLYRSTESRSRYLSPTLLTPGMAFLSYIVQMCLSTCSSLIRHDSIFPVYCLPLSLPNQDTSFTTWHKLALSFSDTFFFFHDPFTHPALGNSPGKSDLEVTSVPVSFSWWLKIHHKIWVWA